MPGFSPLACQLEDIVEEASREFVGAPPIPGRIESLWQLLPGRRREFGVRGEEVLPNLCQGATCKTNSGNK